MSRGWVSLVVLCLGVSIARGDGAHDLQVAARAGDLAQVRRLLEGGVPVDARVQWGQTALALAAAQGHADVVRYLLDKGADPSFREGFFGTSVLEGSFEKGAPEYRVAKMLLAAGAKDRAAALERALEAQDVGLARAAVESGPILASEATDLRARYASKATGELAEILAQVKTAPDPPPPKYTEADLRGFAGRFEGGDDAVATVELRDAKLVLEFGGTKSVLVPQAEKVFGNAESGVTVRYFGRAGTIEGVSIERSGMEPSRLRFADSASIRVGSGLGVRSQGQVSRPDPTTVEWPGFRGANRSGIGDGADTTADFDLDSGKNVLWRVALPGLGNSSPIVWGDRLYVTTAVAEGGSVPLKVGPSGSGEEVEEQREHRWLVLAFDKATGKKLWETEVGRGVPLTKRHFKATQANSTPVTDGEHIVAVFPTAGLACLGKDGAIHWKHELGGLNAGGFNDPGIQWGFAASPILHRGKVILQVDIHDGPYLAAWDLESGKPLWKTPRPDVAPSWATPAIWPTPKGEELVANASVIRGYDPATGRELWSLGPTSIQVVASPVVGQELLYVSSGYPPARPIYAVKPGIRGAHTIASDADAGDLAWYDTRGGAYMPTPLLYRGQLYVVHHNGRIEAHDALTGARVYQARFSAGGTCTSSPVAANGKIYQGTEEGTLYVLAAGNEHKELAVRQLGAPLMATPAISAGVLYVRTPAELIALGEVKPRQP